jgi:hypothetical protein
MVDSWATPVGQVAVALLGTPSSNAAIDPALRTAENFFMETSPVSRQFDQFLAQREPSRA